MSVPDSSAFGRYRLLSRLGEGGMAEVFKAKSFGVEGFEKILVIKRILPKLAIHPKFVEMFVHEAKLAVRLSHANIVQVFDLGRVEHPAGELASYFIAMEYVAGLDLATLLSRCRKQKIAVPIGMAVFITAEVAKALDHAHRRRDEQSRPLGVVHRDISPQNILISWEGEVKVTDFGIAKARDSISRDEEESSERPGRVRGKLAYMSPEQAQAQKLDGRSDIFSLGTVLYEMIAGSNPFVAPTQFETLRRVQASEYPPLELLRADTPHLLVEVVGKMLAKSAEDRFADAGRVHEQLLGYFYATNERFGANQLAEFLERFHDEAIAPEIEASAVFNETNVANERTPVEIPTPSHDKTGGRPVAAANLYRLSSPSSDVSVSRTADIGERREVTALVLSLFSESRGRYVDTVQVAGKRSSTPEATANEGTPLASPGHESGAVQERGLVRPLAPTLVESGATSVLRARAHDVLARYGAMILDDEPSQIVALFGLGDADGRDTDAAVRAALVLRRARGAGVTVSAGVHVARILVDVQGMPIRDERLASLTASAQALSRATHEQVAVSHLASRIIRNEFSTEELSSAVQAPMAAPAGSSTGSSVLSVNSHAVPSTLPVPLPALELGRVVISARAPSAVYGRFIGRHDELKRLGDILAAATRRRPQIAVLQGDKGIGKTRMVAEMERRLVRGNYNVGFYVAACPKNGAEAPWSGLSAMLRVLCGIQEGDDEARILEVLPRLRALGLTSDESSSVLALLGAALAEPGHGLQEDASYALRSAFTRMVQSLSDDRLHVFVLDDAHSIDRATLEVIGGIVGRTKDRESSSPPSSMSGLRAVFIVATREALLEPLASHAAGCTLVLGELSDDESSRLISTRVGARILPPELLAFCRERAGGHPLFLEELLKELTDSGAVTVCDGEVRARLDGATTVPRTLRTLIAGRVSRLDPGERAVLQAAAILGDPVLIEVIAVLMKQSVTQVTRTISSLFVRDFLRITGPAQVSFCSPIHGEIVLDAIPPEARRELHAAAAEAIINTFGEEGVDQAEHVANHLYEAGDLDRAATFFAQTALHKMRVNQLEPAIRSLSRALQLCRYEQHAAHELVLWLSALADCVSRVRTAPDLPSITARLLARVDAVGSPAEKVSARMDVARALSSVNLFEEAYKKLDEALALTGDDARLLSDALAIEIEITGRSGEFGRGARASDRLESLGSIQSSRVLVWLGIIRAACGDHVAALRALDEAERLDRPDDLMAAAMREKQRVLAYIHAHDYRAAIDASKRAIDLARSAGVRYDTAAALHNFGDACWHVGDLPRAYAAFTESKQIAEDAGNERLLMLNRMYLAFLDGMSGLSDTAPLLRDIIRYAESRTYLTDARQARYQLGVLLAQRGEIDDARREFKLLVQQAGAQGDRSMVEVAEAALSKVGTA